MIQSSIGSRTAVWVVAIDAERASRCRQHARRGRHRHQTLKGLRRQLIVAAMVDRGDAQAR
jgi:hypothetical protein